MAKPSPKELSTELNKGGQTFTFKWTFGDEDAAYKAVAAEARMGRGFDWFDATLVAHAIRVKSATHKMTLSGDTNG